MIIFKEVRMRNFRSFGNTWNAVQLDRNKLTLISAPNGSGKSSILMAIEWCLFGKVGNLTKKEIVNQINEKECEVELTIQNSNNGNVYKIQRGINPTYLKIYKNNELVPENSSVKDYQEVINDLTGLNRNVFHRIISINGSSYIPFLSLGQSARREMVEDILEINELRQLNIKNNEALNKVETELNTIKGKIEGLEITVQKIKADNETNDEADNEKIKALLDEMAAVLDGKSLKDVEGELYKMRLSKNSLEQNGERLNKEINFWNADKCPTCGQEIAETLKQEKVSNANEKLKEIAETIEVAGEVIERTENTLRQAKVLENEIASLLAAKKGNKSEQTMEDLQVTIGELTKELESLKETALYHNTIRKWLKDDGVRSVIISKYLPLFNKTLRKYLTDIGIDVNIELDKMFSATITKNNGEERTYSSFSAGERARIDLCFLLSWKSLISSNKFVDTSLLFMDEIYDSVLDAEGLESLVNLLYNMDNTNVFFISHREGIEEAFQNRLVISKDKGFSKIL